MSSRNGFTLLEVMITISLMGFATMTGFHALRNGTLRFQHLTREASPRIQSNTAFSLIGKDLREATLDTQLDSTRFVAPPNAGQIGIQLSFTRRLPESPLRPFEEIQYELRRNIDNSAWNLWKISESVAGRDEKLLLDRLHSFAFSFYDGQQWHSDWGWNHTENKPMRGMRGLPQLIVVRLVLANQDGSTLANECYFPIMTAVLNGAIDHE